VRIKIIFRNGSVVPFGRSDNQRRLRWRPGSAHRRADRIVGALPLGLQFAGDLRWQAGQEAVRQGGFQLLAGHVYDLRPCWLSRLPVLSSQSRMTCTDSAMLPPVPDLAPA